ncbi:hypothetical protein Hanom_Chr09g00806071 [Helianthus anomalus]
MTTSTSYTLSSHDNERVLVGCHDSTNFANATREDPLSCIALTASTFLAFTTSLTTFPSSESINCLTSFCTSAAATFPSSDSFIGRAIFISSTITILFNFCSAYNGHATMGTPARVASNTEFHPQCVTNPPTDS